MDSSFTRILVYFFISMLLFPELSFAQRIDRNVCSSSGKYASNSGIAINYDIGEPIVFTGSGSNVISSQGFVQPDQEIITFSSSSSLLMNMRAFPNPVNDQLYLEINGSLLISDLQLEIFDIYGKKTKIEYDQSSSFLDPEFSLNFSLYKAGVYFIQVSSLMNHFSETFKVIKE
jgi:hypothetical protein